MTFTDRVPSGKPDEASAMSGFALVAAIMIGMVILALAAAWFASIMTAERMVRIEQDRLQARYTAAAGITKLIRSLETVGSVSQAGAAQPLDLSLPQKWSQQIFSDGTSCDMESSLAYGYALVSSVGKCRGARHVEKLRLGIDPDSLFPGALIVGDTRGIILEPGSHIDGDILSPAAPQNWGGNWSGKYQALTSFPDLETKSFDQAVVYFQEVIANPNKAEVELHSPQVFEPGHPIPAGGTIYINDKVLIQSRLLEDGYREVGPKTIVATSDVQISGWAKLAGITILSLGKITLAGNASLSDGIIFSPQEIVLTDDAAFQGIAISLMDISLSGRAMARRPSLIYSASNPSGKILLADAAVLSGIAIFAGPASAGNGIFLEPGAIVNGLIYSSGNASIEGTINGAVATAKLYKAGSDTLQNNRLSGRIKRSGMTRMALPLCFGAKPKKGWHMAEKGLFGAE